LCGLAFAKLVFELIDLKRKMVQQEEAENESVWVARGTAPNVRRSRLRISMQWIDTLLPPGPPVHRHFDFLDKSSLPNARRNSSKDHRDLR
jgi:hypothetical protein